jgi:hypothetical protein
MMVVVVLLLGFIALAAGMFGVGLGIPVKDTTFGAAVLMSASVALTGGLVLLGLAAAVSELRRVLQAGLRQARVPEGFEAERGGRRMEPRINALDGACGAVAGAAAADAATIVPARFDAPEVMERPSRPVREERPPAAPVNRRGPAVYAAAGPAVGEGRRREPPDGFEAVRPADYRKPDKPRGAAPELQVAAAQAPAAAATTGGEVNAPPLSPAEAASSPAASSLMASSLMASSRAAGLAAAGPATAHSAAARPPAADPGTIKPVRVLKSGKIDDVAYTLFSDGSIETQTPSATLHFASIDDFRKHLEKTA